MYQYVLFVKIEKSVLLLIHVAIPCVLSVRQKSCHGTESVQFAEVTLGTRSTFILVDLVFCNPVIYLSTAKMYKRNVIPCFIWYKELDSKVI